MHCCIEIFVWLRWLTNKKTMMIMTEKPDRDNCNDRTYSCLRDWCLLASWGQFKGTLKPVKHQNSMVSKGLKGALSWSPWCRQTSPFHIWLLKFFQSVREYFPCHQVRSVVTSLLTLSLSFTTYHRTSKLGGLGFLSSLPLFSSLLFQVQLSVTL